jgi:rRNA maturation RNase YbeY
VACAVVVRPRRLAVGPARLARAAERALAAVGRAGGQVELLIVDDAQIRRLNAAFRGIRRRTDVLSFPMEIAGAPGGLVGQVVVSAETARRQARQAGVSPALELELLITHGVLHLVGYDDRDPVEARFMHARERQILAGGGRRLPARLWRGLLHP